MADAQDTSITKEKTSMTMTRHDRRSVFSWCLYDWGNSAFATVIITFVYSVYFARGIVGDETAGAAQWSMGIAISGVIIAILSPILGGIADHYGARKPWVLAFTMIFVLATALLYFGAPGAGPGHVLFIIALLVLANTAFEIALVFNNAMLTHIAPPEYLGRISGWSWGMGYAGGLVCLVLSLVFLIGLGGMPPLLGLSTTMSENIRAVGPLVAVWVLVFTIPMMLYTRDIPRTMIPMGRVVSQGLRQLAGTLRSVRKQGNMMRFLIGSAVYRDGLNTLFAVGGLYAAGTFGMSFEEILLFAIGLNVTAGIGAAGFAGMDDLKGSRQTVIMSLCGLILSGLAVLMVQDKMLFICLAMVMGLFIGPVQSASRTMAARLSDPAQIGQTFGLYSLTGRVVAFFGPAAYAAATHIFDSQRAGMAMILLFWLVGLVILWGVKEQERRT
jgi:UMF1 family MFS transporter